MSRKSLLAVVVCLIASSTFAYTDHQETPPESSRQAMAQRVFDRYVKALGGQEAYGKIATRSLKGKFEYNGSSETTPGSFEAQRAEGTVETYWKTPDRVAQALLGGPLVVRRGFNGKDAW